MDLHRTQCRHHKRDLYSDEGIGQRDLRNSQPDLQPGRDRMGQLHILQFRDYDPDITDVSSSWRIDDMDMRRQRRDDSHLLSEEIAQRRMWHSSQDLRDRRIVPSDIHILLSRDF